MMVDFEIECVATTDNIFYNDSKMHTLISVLQWLWNIHARMINIYTASKQYWYVQILLYTGIPAATSIILMHVIVTGKSLIYSWSDKLHMVHK